MLDEAPVRPGQEKGGAGNVREVRARISGERDRRPTVSDDLGRGFRGSLYLGGVVGRVRHHAAVVQVPKYCKFDDVVVVL